MHNSRIKRITVAVCLAFMPFAANAAGLGKLTIISSLGQPLNAEVELLSATLDELSSLKAQIAPSNVYAEQGIERSSILSAVHVDVASRADGVPVLRITSSQPVNDPFLDMLVQVEWSSGSLLREYTALLDPPGFGDQPPATATAEPQTQSMTAEQPVSERPVASKATKAKKGKATKAVTEPGSTESKQAAEATTATKHTVKAGDTLGGIASKMATPEGVSLDQMLVGLYRANPEAFTGNNMNRLKVGQIVRQPSAEELQTVSPQDASNEVRVQAADWNSYRSKLASAVAESAPAKDDGPRQGVSGKITAPAEDKGAAPATGPRDVVKLSKGDAATKASSPSKDAGGAKDAAVQEEVTAREKAIKEANERVAVLEKQVQELKQLLEMKNQSLADIQNAAAAKGTETAKLAEPAKSATTEPTPAAAAPAPVAEAAKVEEAKPVEVKPEAEKPQHKPKKIVPPPPPPEITPLDVVLNIVQENLSLIGALLLALGAGGWLAKRRKMPKKAVSAPAEVMPVTSGVAASLMEDFQQAEREEMIENNEVDPISVAEGYMSYGRDTQAEDILKEAIKKDPKRYDLHSKLLEVYAERKDEAAISQMADELQGELGVDAPVVKKALELGRKLDPYNPRYASAAQQEPADFAAMETFAADTTSPDDDLQLPTDANLDFSLDTPAAETPQPEENAAALDFDISVPDNDGVDVLEMPDVELEAPAPQATEPSFLESVSELDALPELGTIETPAEVVEEPADEMASLDFALDLPEPAMAENAQLDAADLGLPDLGLPELGAAETETPAVEALPELDALESTELQSTEMPEFAAPELEAPALAAVEPEMADEIDMALTETSPDLDAAEVAEEAVAEPAKKPRGRKSKKAAQEEAAPVEEEVTGFEMPPELEDAAPVDGSLDGMMLELPEMEVDAAAEDLSADLGVETPAEGVAGMDLILPEIEEPAVEATEAATQEDVSFDLPEVAESGAVEVAGMTVEETSPEDISFDLAETEPAAEPVLPELEEAAAPVKDDGLVVEEISFEMPVEETPVVPAVDFSGIDLDLDQPKPVAQVVQEIEEEIVFNTPAESADVDTKLDLVTAYLDMGDKEGARELLQEVLEEGGPKQKERAQKIMDGL